MRGYVHTCVRTWLLMEKYMHSCKHAPHTYINPYMYYILPYIHTYIHKFIHACMLRCMHTCIHTYARTCVPAYVHTYIQACKHVNTQTTKRKNNTHIRTYIHTCLHTETYRLPLPATVYIYLWHKRTAVQLRCWVSRHACEHHQTHCSAVPAASDMSSKFEMPRRKRTSC